MLHFVPNWLLWVVVLAAAFASPFVALLVVFLIGELLWDAVSTLGAAPTLGLCAGALGLLLFLKWRPRPPQAEAESAG